MVHYWSFKLFKVYESAFWNNALWYEYLWLMTFILNAVAFCPDIIFRDCYMSAQTKMLFWGSNVNGQMPLRKSYAIDNLSSEPLHYLVKIRRTGIFGSRKIFSSLAGEMYKCPGKILQVCDNKLRAFS